jgi:hypothetical protein
LALNAGDGDEAVLEGLAQGLESRAVELAELVEEENAAVCEARLAGARARTAAHDRRCRGRVVRRAKRRSVE